MNNNISFRIKLSFFLRRILHSFLRLIPKQDGLVLLTAWFGEKYIDNTKYVYEYLLKDSNYKVCWMTRNLQIYQQLKKDNKPVALFNSLEGILKQIRAQAVFSTIQLYEYDQRLLTNTIYIDLGHGHPIKDPGKNQSQEPILSIQKHYLANIHYYGIKASEFAKKKYQDVVPVTPDRVFISDFARNDVFIDESLRVGKNAIVDEYKKDRKAIVYMPTHRSDGKRIMDLNTILPFDDIQVFCEENDYVFIIKKHFYHRNETEDLSKYNRIFDITNEDDIDPQVLLYQTDVLISDYSACYIDYLLLDRPLMFYHYDLKEFQEHERSLYIPFEKIDIAPIAYSKSDFIEQLRIACNPEDIYGKKRRNFTPTYFKNTKQKNGRRKVKQILDQLMEKYYKKQ
mgnify:CR=1 FL=1